MSDDLRATIAEVWARHRGSACEQLAVVRAAVEHLAAGALPDDERDAAKAEAHKLAGALGVYGFGAGSGLALRAEEALDPRRAPDADPAGLADALRRLELELAGDGGR